MVSYSNLKDMHGVSKDSRSSDAAQKQTNKEPITPRARSNSNLSVPLVSPIPRHRLSPALDEFSLRRTPSRGATASPAPAKGVRKRLHKYHNFDDAAKLIGQSRNIVVLTGAGISTSVGIPDFRSDKGLYSQLSKDLGITEAEEFFSRDYFIHNTQQFFQYVRRVIPEAVIGSDGSFKATNPNGGTSNGIATVPKFSLTHAFLALLQSKSKLLTNYTQNIDGLELAAGVPRTKFIQCHGSWDTASCMTCGRSSTARKYLPVVFAGNIPFCKCKLESEQKSQKRQKKRSGKKRSWDEFDSDHSSDDGTQAPRGLLKPDITFFNERLSGLYNERLDEDKRMVDLLIIIGTSLKVGPVQDMLYQISPKVPQIFISRERFSGALCNLPGVQVDIELLGECDVIVEELCRRAGWSGELRSLCWERGQMKIKELQTGESRSETKQEHESVDLNSHPLHHSTSDERPSKRTKKLEHEFADSNATLDRRQEPPERIPEVSVHKAAKISSNGVTISEDSIKVSAYCTEPQAPLEATSNRSKLEVIPEEPETVTQVETITKSDESRVKIELVEGTAHQWRITRR